MPKFAYAAIDTAGTPVEGVTKADTIGAARAILVEQNLFPTKIEERRGMLDFELSKEKVKKKHLMQFTRQLAVFVKAGIPITDALVTIGDETEDVALRRALGKAPEKLKVGIGKLQLNDAALVFTAETSVALGFGFRCGFLGLLHMEIVTERLRREYDLDIISTYPSVVYKVEKSDGTELEVHNPMNLPDGALTLDTTSGVPIYRQIIDRLRTAASLPGR